MKFAVQVTCVFSIVRRAGCVPRGGCVERLRYLIASRLEDAEDAAFTGRSSDCEVCPRLSAGENERLHLR